MSTQKTLSQTSSATSVPSVPALVDGKAELVTITPELEQRVTRVKQYHKGIVTAAQDQAVLVGLAGAELLLLKEALPHKAFTPFVEQHFGTEVSMRSCQRYMATVRDLASKNDTVSFLLQESATDGGLVGERREKYLLAWHDFADGKTITAIYRDTGTIRDPKDAEHHPRKPVDVEATEAQLDQAANEDWCAIIADVELHLGVLERITPENQDRALATLLKATALLRTLGKSKKKPGRATLLRSPDQNSSKARTQPPVAATGAAKQSTWIALRSAEGNISVREDDKLPPKEHRGLTDYEGPFLASGKDHAMAKARMLFPSKSSRHTKATEARLAKEKELHDLGEAYEAAHAAEAPGGKGKPSAIARARLNAAARNRWANAKEKGAK